MTQNRQAAQALISSPFAISCRMSFFPDGRTRSSSMTVMTPGTVVRVTDLFSGYPVRRSMYQKNKNRKRDEMKKVLNQRHTIKPLVLICVRVFFRLFRSRSCAKATLSRDLPSVCPSSTTAPWYFRSKSARHSEKAFCWS